tara:strand:- start:36601 stop:36879 length:279 start_codon:yes stop_codon:yes gene_type:complete
MAQASAQHILVSTEEMCNQLIEKIKTGTPLQVLAPEYSQCASGTRGGDLGTFGPGQMVPEFDKVIWSAPINKVQGPIKTDFGYHLIVVTNRT